MTGKFSTVDLALGRQGMATWIFPAAVGGADFTPVPTTRNIVAAIGRRGDSGTTIWEGRKVVVRAFARCYDPSNERRMDRRMADRQK